jgi:Big-like domain-containing protein
MRIRNGRLSPAAIGLVLAAFMACRPTTPGGGPSDTVKPSQPSDSGAPSPLSNTVRADSVVLRTDKTQYRAGEKITLTFENKSASSYTFNPCTRSVERESGGSWVTVPEENRVCTMEAWVLDPHGTRTGPTELPATMAPGRYRVVVRMTMESSPGGTASAVSAISDPITVT